MRLRSPPPSSSPLPVYPKPSKEPSPHPHSPFSFFIFTHFCTDTHTHDTWALAQPRGWGGGGLGGGVMTFKWGLKGSSNMAGLPYLPYLPYIKLENFSRARLCYLPSAHVCTQLFYSNPLSLSLSLHLRGDLWRGEANQTYISDAGWYFKTLAVQEVGEFCRNDWNLGKNF